MVSNVLRVAAAALAPVVALTMASAPSRAAAQRPGPPVVAPKDHAKVQFPNLRWRPVAGASLYELQIAQDRRFADIVETIKTDATQFIDTEQWPAASYWWRVRAVGTTQTQWSKPREFTQRWMVPDAHNGAMELARPDNVTVADFLPDPGSQAPLNAIQISWEPVANASYYVVELDPAYDMDPDLIPPYSPEDSVVCLTPHTVLTPNIDSVSLPQQGPTSQGGPGLSLIDDVGDYGCQIEAGNYWVRVRAVDRTSVGTENYSLWSDEARHAGDTPAGPQFFTVNGDLMKGSSQRQPAQLLAPADGTVFLDAPVMAWEPVDWATSYKVVIAADRNFTAEVGQYYTTNTRFIPLERIPEDNSERSYYWYVVPCQGASTPPDACVSSNKVVNRTGSYRSFKKLSPLTQTSPAKRFGPWTRVGWTPFSRTAMKVNKDLRRAYDSIGGIDGYEIQLRNPGTDWPETGVLTDLPVYMQSETEASPGPRLSFGQRYEWRVRIVDGSGQSRPWSATRAFRLPVAEPGQPKHLEAQRRGKRITLTWQAPKPRYFPVDGYQVFYSRNGKRWKPLDTVLRLRAAYRVSPKQKYWFMVNAVSRGGEGRPAKVFVPR